MLCHPVLRSFFLTSLIQLLCSFYVFFYVFLSSFFLFFFFTLRNGLTIFSNDIDARVTEAAVGRTKNYYIYLYERQLLPKEGQPPAEVGPEESKANWYEQEDQRWVIKMRE